MKILHDYREFPPSSRSSITIGNFDGLHLGHRRILQEMTAMANASGTCSALLTFSPHPLEVLHPAKAPKLILDPQEKIERIRALGVDYVLILKFDRELSLLSGEDFIREILVKSLRARHVFVGRNFVFGHKRSGNVALLEALGQECDYVVNVISPVEVRGARVSSTWIRELIQSGRISMANRLLGRFYSLRGRIVHGQGFGQKFLFPTLNLQPEGSLLPANGVYVSLARFEGRNFQAVTNIGTRPTVSGTGLAVETHLLHQSLETPPDTMEVQFLHRLRDEQKFPGIEALRVQIAKDVQRASRFFRLLERLHQSLISN
ncbi:MAG TPA: bifunctional riboflavin kinase/FAD synthetase [Terriglobia bacterium]|jgi:riboflavin kinase/FMN adenylyltransferase|nr:bifunctional riboflavin kinase/FAD synthetase [Terriglobia bacterium]